MGNMTIVREVKACPFCFAPTIKLFRDVDGSFCGVCDNCYARGPRTFVSGKAAFDLWNLGSHDVA